ncbi:MAG: hypothetical protein V7K67_14355 [Nostoc sp.]|uniref:hypothetical protein n=1 Tax=Nostoc sp. TaxID=1180 RepID=UPI002FFAE977
MSFSELQFAKSSAVYLLRTSRNHNSVLKISQATIPVVSSVTDFRVNTTKLPTSRDRIFYGEPLTLQGIISWEF